MIRVGALPRFARPLEDVSVKVQQKVSYVADFAAEDTIEISLLTQQQQRAFGTPRCIYMNNAYNPNAVEVLCDRTQFSTVFPAFGVGFIPLDALDTDTIILYSAGGASDVTKVAIYNYEIAPGVWFATDPLSPGFDVQAVLPEAASIQVLNNQILAGVAENVFPASASAGYKWARNLSNEVVYWRVGAAATGNFVTDMVMNPGEGFNGQDCQLGFRTAAAISFFCAANADIQAMDWLVN